MHDDILEAIGEPSRRELLTLLHQHGEMTVSALVDASGMRQPQVSKHLKVLASASAVAVRPQGRCRYYRLDPKGLKAAHDWFRQFEDVWQSRFDALDALVSNDTATTNKPLNSPDESPT